MGSSWTPSGPTGSLRQGGLPDGAPLPEIPVSNTFDACPDTPIGSLRQGGRNTVTSASFSNGRGAGRSLEYVYPAPSSQTGGGDAGISGLSRFGYVDGQQTGFAQNPGSSVATYYKGRVCFKGSAPTGQIGATGPAVPFPAFKGGAPQRGQFHCWRVKAILAFEPNDLVKDLGLQLIVGQSTGIKSGNNPGFGLRPHTDNSVEFYARAAVAGPITISDFVPIQITVAEWNCYEYRIIGATDSQDALLKVLINNREQFRYSFGDGLLPALELQVSLNSIGGGNYYLPIGGLSTMAAYDEDSLL